MFDGAQDLFTARHRIAQNERAWWTGGYLWSWLVYPNLGSSRAPLSQTKAFYPWKKKLSFFINEGLTITWLWKLPVIVIKSPINRGHYLWYPIDAIVKIWMLVRCCVYVIGNGNWDFYSTTYHKCTPRPQMLIFRCNWDTVTIPVETRSSKIKKIIDHLAQ